MYKITEKVALNPTVTKMVIEAPLIAKKAKPGQPLNVWTGNTSAEKFYEKMGMRTKERQMEYIL